MSGPEDGPTADSGADTGRDAPHGLISPWLSDGQPGRSWIPGAQAPPDSWSWPGWSALGHRIRTLRGSTRLPHDALIWLALTAGLGLYGWYGAGLRHPDGGPAVESVDALDGAAQDMVSETASLEENLAKGRQLGESPGRTREPPTSRTSLATQILGLGGRQTEQGLVIVLPNSELSFPIGKANLPRGDLSVLDRLAAVLVQHPAVDVRVEGHTDSAGRDEVNLALSQGRAEAVKEALMRRGLGAGRIQSIGYGETRPIADNSSRAGRDSNRRIEIYLTEDAS